MSRKCLFIYIGQPNMSYALASKRDYSIKREPQIGFAYLLAALRQHGVESEVLDFTITPYTKNSLNNYIAENSPYFVGFYASADTREYLAGFLRFIRQNSPHLKIFVGGPDMYDCESYLNAGADAYCLGEGEKTIVELFESCQGRKEKEQIRGIAYREEDKIHYTPPRELIEDLDELPLPAWDRFNLTKYYDYHVFDMVQPYTSIIASRGCPFRCTYCTSHKFWGNVYRRRSPENVLKEIDYLVREHGVRYIMFQDDIWSWGDDDWAREICQKLITRKYNLKWRCILHPMSFLKSRREILPLMKAAGCTSITIGLQSASGKILFNINRSPAQPEVLADLISQSKKAGLLNSIEFIIGLPGETEETIEENIQYALKIKPTFCGFYVLSVLAGSDIWLDQKAGKFQPLSDHFVHRKCKEAARRFYTNPSIFLTTLKSVIKANPRWLLRTLGHTKYLLEISGIFSKKR